MRSSYLTSVVKCDGPGCKATASQTGPRLELFAMLRVEGWLTTERTDLCPACHAGPSLIRQARLTRRWSQRDLARRIGVSAMTVSKWERGMCKPEPCHEARMAATFTEAPP